MLWRVYANYGEGDTNKFGFRRKKDARRMMRIARKHEGLKWVSLKKVQGKG